MAQPYVVCSGMYAVRVLSLHHGQRWHRQLVWKGERTWSKNVIGLCKYHPVCTIALDPMFRLFWGSPALIGVIWIAKRKEVSFNRSDRRRNPRYQPPVFCYQLCMPTAVHKKEGTEAGPIAHQSSSIFGSHFGQHTLTSQHTISVQGVQGGGYGGVWCVEGGGGWGGRVGGGGWTVRSEYNVSIMYH